MASRQARWLLGVGLLALVVRVLYVVIVLRDYAPVSDARHYHTLAAAIGDGRGVVHEFPFGYAHPTAFRPPLYPLLLGAVYAITGPKLGAAAALNVLLGTGVVVLAALTAWRLAGRTAGVVTGIVTAMYPPLVFNDGPPLSEPLGLLLLLAVALLLIDRRTAWAGAASGLLVLTRSSAQLFVVVLTAWVLWRMGWRRALSYAMCLTLAVAPWVIRNWYRFGTPVVVTSNGFNLNAIYSPEAKASGGFVDGVFDPRFADMRAGISNEAELDAVFRRHALAEIRRDPRHVLRIAPGQLMNMFEPRAGRNDVAEANDGRNLRLQHHSVPLVGYASVLGMAGLLAVRGRGVGPLVLAALVFTALSAVTVATPRMRAPLDVACCVGVGALAARVAQAWGARQLRRPVPVGG
ncbi:MAG TPA: hypothetical protein VHF24_01515 [Acidimicrobiales bacterium]|nr:hypothetical protein [Acidimicrobiales bacterium]